MHPGEDANSRESVAAQRAWKLTTIYGRTCMTSKDFIVKFSVEDTGDTSASLFDPVDLNYCWQSFIVYGLLCFFQVYINFYSISSIVCSNPFEMLIGTPEESMAGLASASRFAR